MTGTCIFVDKNGPQFAHVNESEKAMNKVQNVSFFKVTLK
jgi:beta-lactamase class D